MRPAAVAAIVLEVLFLACLLVADLVAGRIDLTISEGVHGPLPWLVSLAFLLHAASLVALAMALRRIPAAAAGVAALGMVMVAGFPTGPVPWVQALHVLGATLAFGGIAVAAGSLPRLRVLATIVVVGTVVMGASLVFGGFPAFERVQVLINGVWILAAAWPAAFPGNDRPTPP